MAFADEDLDGNTSEGSGSMVAALQLLVPTSPRSPTCAGFASPHFSAAVCERLQRLGSLRGITPRPMRVPVPVAVLAVGTCSAHRRSALAHAIMAAQLAGLWTP